MSKEKQIEEMAWDLCDIPKHPSIKSCEQCGNKRCHAMYYAERAYNAGYRKQSEGEWIGRRYNFDDDFPILEKSHYLKCNKCGHLHALYIYNPFLDRVKLVNVFEEGITIPNFCPNCGAKMKGGEE